MADSPDFTGQPVGAILARWRKQRRLTGQALGDRVGMTQSRISRLETGVIAAEPSDIRALGRELGVPADDVEKVVAMVERVDERLTDWLPESLDLAERQDETARIEKPAKEIRVFQPAVVPGLAQTDVYARAVLSGLKDGLDDARVADSAIAVANAVNARVQRAGILLLPDRSFHFLMTEQVLRNQVCEPAAMIAQIARLRELAAYPNVRLRIIGDDAELPIAPFHGFYVADDRWVSVDLFNSTLKARGAKIVHTYRRVFDLLEAVALPDAGNILNDYEKRYARMLLPN
ncbi:helix-turn-helix transcriptional regulator [Actinoplanes sp. KI2]|uniref:helix-turn-helix domain-containing protein n=1 Tax=Actinoplanes sp. KI2 TaxID=2983315 RepID=UPI0021D5D4F4|nr:helix-turn-helix transcriptional regulator [Actinoplanes sp. KI2]MCU7730330.1 helix-turn-helix transcriptional regulator [Actinoplanes sp. KI2]